MLSIFTTKTTSTNTTRIDEHIEPLIWASCDQSVPTPGYACKQYGIEYCGCDYCDKGLYRFNINVEVIIRRMLWLWT
jgi:hypothetical protein